MLSKRLEITCGEAPYIASRYDTVSGEPIEIKRRIGILDRKLRVVTENAEDCGQSPAEPPHTRRVCVKKDDSAFRIPCPRKNT